MAEAVYALLRGFVGAVSLPSSPAHFMVFGDTDDELLLGALRTVIEHVRIWQEVPVRMKVTAIPDGLMLHCEMVPISGISPIGAIPKGVSVQDIRCESRQGRWWCTASVDL